MKLDLNNISITGFRNYKEEVSYKMAKRVKIFGDNALGKSTIKEAFCWGLTGCDSTGNEKATTKLVNNDKPKYTEVVLDFNLDGEPCTVIRRKKGSSTDIYFNDKKVTTSDLSRDIFKNKSVFLSIVNPYYFPSLTPKDAKALLSDVLKPVGRDVIFSELGDYLKKVMLDNGFRMPETFLSDCRSNLKEQEENIIYLQGVIDGATKQEVPEKMIFEKQLELDEAKSKLYEIEKPIPIERQLKELEIEEKSLRQEFNNIAYQPTKDVSVLKHQREVYLADYKSNKSKLDNLKSNYIECPNCNLKVDTTLELRAQLVKNIKDITAKGKDIATEIETILLENKKIETQNIEFREKKKLDLDFNISQINSRREEIKANEEIELEKYKKATESLQETINELEKEKSNVEANNILCETAEANNSSVDKKIKEAEEGITNSTNKIAQLKLAIDAGKQYNSIRVKKQSEQISKYLDKVNIQFEKVTKDGEIQDKFEILYDGKEFSKLSGSERIKAGLEIANLFINVSNMQIPIFVDDAESINVIPELDTQMIIIKVTDDKTIKVEVER